MSKKSWRKKRRKKEKKKLRTKEQNGRRLAFLLENEPSAKKQKEALERLVDVKIIAEHLESYEIRGAVKLFFYLIKRKILTTFAKLLNKKDE